MSLIDPDPNGTEPIFHEILRCLSVSTPTVVFEGLELRLRDSEALVEALGED